MNYIKYYILLVVLFTSALNVNSTIFKDRFTYNYSFTNVINQIILEEIEDYTNPTIHSANIHFLKKNNSQYFSEKKNNIKHKTLNNNNKIFNYLLISFISICSILIILLIFIVSKLRTSNTKIKNLEIKEKATLQQQIKRKEEEMLATVMVVSAQQKELKKALNAIEYIKKEKKDPNIDKIYYKIKNIIKSSSNLNLIFQKLESQYTYFSTSIKSIHPNLTENDIRNCILIRLSFSLKDSAELLNVSVHAIKMARQRIRKKINYSSNISLKEYLDTFENEQSILKKV